MADPLGVAVQSRARPQVDSMALFLVGNSTFILHQRCFTDSEVCIWSGLWFCLGNPSLHTAVLPVGDEESREGRGVSKK